MKILPDEFITVFVFLHLQSDSLVNHTSESDWDENYFNLANGDYKSCI